MARKPTLSVLVAIAAVCVATAQAPQQKPLTNADVVSMVKAGISESTIVLAIQKGATQFETDADALIKLKRAGVTDRILAAMLNSASAAKEPTQNNLDKSRF